MKLFGWGKRKEERSTSGDAIREVRTESELLDAIGEGTAVVYKHSNRCGLSFRAEKEVRTFAEAHPDVPVVKIDVVASRPLSNLVAERFEVVHQSPQVIVVRDGRAVWSASHLGVTAGGLSRATLAEHLPPQTR